MVKVKTKLVCGIGINDVDYCVQLKIGSNKIMCPYYIKWMSMMVRCYSKKTYRWYKDCSVCDEWLTFSNFKAWMEAQDWEERHLDKDLLVKGNKVYSPETCAFIGADINSFLTDCYATRGKHPVGVCWRKDNKVFRAYCNNPFTKRREHLGNFKEAHAAHLAWQAKKHEYACQLAELQEDSRVADALRQRYAPDKNWSVK